MTAKELIEALSQYPPDTPVVVRGYEGGYNDIQAITPVSIQLNVNQIWYYGAHGTNDDQINPLPEVPLTPVIYLHSYNHIAEEDWHGC
ncbi:hypothetical protein [Phormidium sp. FACHB-1136]|uniref:hypothetical protein n=1 Tax=Phormidium sp. FACHB-1136 TaxID=2692848 RepID=UPI001688C6F0|nr:hypothetical protein [Phormidium sp. FACHB-1136]MBD2427710.1 hypothetical protein [Phormidium sp. FACHB-1136]